MDVSTSEKRNLSMHLRAASGVEAIAKIKGKFSDNKTLVEAVTARPLSNTTSATSSAPPKRNTSNFKENVTMMNLDAGLDLVKVKKVTIRPCTYKEVLSALSA